MNKDFTESGSSTFVTMNFTLIENPLSLTHNFTGGPGPIFSLPMDGLGPGSYTYNITAFSPDGQRSSSVIAFRVIGITICMHMLAW